MSTESLDQLSDLSLISDCSYHSDSDQDQVEPVFQEERKPVVRRQKNQENGIDLVEVGGIILISVILTLSVAYLNRPIHNQTTESAPTVTNTTNTTDTFNPTEYMKTLGERRMMKTSEILGDQEKVARAQRVVESKEWSKLADCGNKLISMSTESLDELSDLSDISDCSYHSDSDEGEIVKVVRRKKKQESGIDADDVVCIILLLLFIMLSVIGGFTVFQVVFLRNPIQKTESAPIITNTNGTFNSMENMKFLAERRMMRTSEILEDQEKVARAQRVAESKGWSRLADVPEYYWDKFMPDITRFEGMDAYLHKTAQNGTQVEEALYFHPIKLWKISKDGFINTFFEKINMWGTIGTSWPSLNHGIFNMANVGSCDPKTECYKRTFTFEKGDLVFKHIFTMEGGQTMIVKTVYYIPAKTFI